LLLAPLSTGLLRHIPKETFMKKRLLMLVLALAAVVGSTASKPAAAVTGCGYVCTAPDCCVYCCKGFPCAQPICDF
jgi:hypothetical protein